MGFLQKIHYLTEQFATLLPKTVVYNIGRLVTKFQPVNPTTAPNWYLRRTNDLYHVLMLQYSNNISHGFCSYVDKSPRKLIKSRPLETLLFCMNRMLAKVNNTNNVTIESQHFNWNSWVPHIKSRLITPKLIWNKVLNHKNLVNRLIKINSYSNSLESIRINRTIALEALAARSETISSDLDRVNTNHWTIQFLNQH